MINRSRGKRHKAIVLLIVIAILWSSGGLLVKSVSWHPIAIAGARSPIAALLLLARAQDNAVELERCPVELDTLLLDVYRQARTLAGDAQVVKLGKKEAELHSVHPMAPLTNIMLKFQAPEGEGEFEDTYAKVLDRPMEEPDRFFVHFTTLPPEVKGLIEKLIA